MTASALEARIRESFNRQTMMGTIGASLTVIEPGRVVIESPIPDGFRQQHGFAHGGLVFTLADNAGGYAAISALPPDHDVLTLELKINFLNPGGGRLIAEGRVVRAGRRAVVITSDVWAENGAGERRHVATAQGTMIPVTST